MSDATVFSDIRSALRTRLFAIAGLPAARKLDGESLDAPMNAAWIRETLLRKAPPRKRTIGSTPGMELKLLYQIDYFQPTSTASGVETDATAHELAAGVIVAAFYPTLALVNGGVRINITESGVGRIDEGSPHNRIPVEIYVTARYYADN